MSCAEIIMCQGDAGPPSGQLPDEQLLARYRSGDGAAAAALFKRYCARLEGLVRKERGWLLRGAEEPADLVQSVFESIFKRARDGQIVLGPDDSLWPLLHMITVNKIRSRIRYYRRQQRDRRREVPLEENDPLETDPQPEDVARENELIEQLLGPFEPLRRTIIEHLLLGIPAAEIARRVGVSKRTVYRTRRAAMQILEQILVAS